ncbi:transcription factor Pcc1 [Neoconidiobolus thromboides FSU 785]|nr:transcription factor Pcc1 [Neoconidiobolus thromboides FSU 785]
MKYSIELQIPFHDHGLSRQALQVISVDKELRDKEIQRILTIDEVNPQILKAKFSSNSKKMLRVSINSFLDLLMLIRETQSAFVISD